MARTRWTPGPWKVEFNCPTAIFPGHIIRTDNDVERPIALLWVGGGTQGKPTQIANAHLLRAAPALAEALRAAVQHASAAAFRDNVPWLISARAALSLAYGEEG